MFEDIYAERQKQKEQYEKYREKARELIITTIDLASYAHNVPDIKVPQHANVMPCEDGAFVDCVIWVPKEKL